MPRTASALAWLEDRFELNRGGRGQNLRSMEGLRGLAVMLVFMAHYGALLRPWIAPELGLIGTSYRLVSFGGCGVDLFFLLSGFLIYGSLIARPQAFLPYFWRRLRRLYPAFLVVFAIYIVLSVVFPSQSKIPPGLGPGAAYVALNFAMLPGIVPVVPMITVAWSLSYEIAYYAAMPLVISLAALRERSTSQRVWFFVVVGLLSALAFALFGGPVRLIMFLAGILLYELLSTKHRWSPSNALALVCLLGGVASTQLPWHGDLGYLARILILFTTFFVVCWLCFAKPEAGLPRLLSWWPLRWLGNMSYSYYLVHGLAMHGALLLVAELVPKQTQGPLFFWAFVPLLFAWTLLPAAVLFLTVERPWSLVRR